MIDVIKYNIEITTGSEMIKNEAYTERIKNDNIIILLSKMKRVCNGEGLISYFHSVISLYRT